MPKFLNRLLALPIEEQNTLFAELETRIDANIEQAMEAGTFEQGVENILADSLLVASREELRIHERTGAATELVEIARRDRLEPLTADAAIRLRGQALAARRQGRARARGADGQRPLEPRRRAGAGPVAHAGRRQHSAPRAAAEGRPPEIRPRTPRSKPRTGARPTSPNGERCGMPKWNPCPPTGNPVSGS